MALGMITVFVNVMTKESMIAVMNQKIRVGQQEIHPNIHIQ